MKSKWQKFAEGEIALRVERDDFWGFAMHCENCNIMYRGGGVRASQINPFHIYPNKKYIIFYCVNPGYTAPWCKLVYTDEAGLKQKLGKLLGVDGDIPIENYFGLELIKNNETVIKEEEE